MTLAEQVNEVFESVHVPEIVPHVADKIEPGAILYSSWGYDQTNVDYYMVTRATKSSCWIVPMEHVEEPSGYMSGHTTPLEPMTHTAWCTCDHRVTNHHEHGCYGAYGDACECAGVQPVPVRAKMHRIKRYGTSESLTLTSYSGAYLWDGKAKYASHYA